MIAYFDTSSLIKKYIDEEESESVYQLFLNADKVFVSYITKIECFSALKRFKSARAITSKEYLYLKEEIFSDFEFYTAVNPMYVESKSIALVEKYQLKTLDAIQLSCALSLKDEINFFICNDQKLIDSAQKERLHVIKPKAR